LPVQSDNLQELLGLLDRLTDLNPEQSYEERRHLLELADHVGDCGFEPVAGRVRRLIELYLASPVKRLGRDIMTEYFQELARGAKLLAEAGEIAPQKQIPEAASHSLSTALIPRTNDVFSCLDRCKLLNRCSIPQPLTKAADAYRRRLEVVSTVLEIGFQVLWRVSPEHCQQWLLAYLDEHDGNLDPDILRDMLSVALGKPQVNRQLLAWAERWGADESLWEYWPYLLSYADRLLCRQALQRWRRGVKPRGHLQAHLLLLTEKLGFSDDSLLEWETEALEEIGDGVQRFMSLSAETLEGKNLSKEDEAWRQAALFSELHRLEALFRPVLLSADQVLRLPDGATKLAMAFLGLTGAGLENWEERVQKMSERLIKMAFLRDLKEHRSPVETIRRMTFGDSQAFNAICAELDLLTEQFDSLQQRDKVVKVLAIYYASYRRADILSSEVSRRYRNLRRVLHEDYWLNILDKPQHDALTASGMLKDLNSLAAAARQFLDRRRSQEATLEEMLASEMEFTRFVRQKRLKIIHSLLE
jgi:hypothetical protein